MTSAIEGLAAVADTELLYKGAAALETFYDRSVGCVLRAAGPTPLRRDENGHFPAATGATSSNRAFLATLELVLNFCEEQWMDPELTIPQPGRARWHELGGRLHENLRDMTARYYTHDLKTLQEHSENGRNDFTNAHLTTALASLHSSVASDYLGLPPVPGLAATVAHLADALEASLLRDGGARLSQAGEPHPLITLHAVRAVEVARHVTGGETGRSRVSGSVESTLRARARDDVLRQFGLHAADDAEFDPSALIAGASLLYRFAELSARRLVHKSLEILAATQGQDGSWKTRILAGDRQLIYIPSLELAVLVANLALWERRRRVLRARRARRADPAQVPELRAVRISRGRAPLARPGRRGLRRPCPLRRVGGPPMHSYCTALTAAVSAAVSGRRRGGMSPPGHGATRARRHRTVRSSGPGRGGSCTLRNGSQGGSAPRRARPGSPDRAGAGRPDQGTAPRYVGPATSSPSGTPTARASR
ncbi:MAG: hypothetical protein LC789_14465 [Actinobacteria bacterium]|nr:hypothetical protein [Actinomycetota bacterium]MCA1720797.1 hypothetical protein [Actinomycetota bacterium]